MQEPMQPLEKALEIIDGIGSKMKPPKPVDEIEYRPDYQDYRVYLEDKTHSEIREVLVDNVVKKVNLSDTIMEIEFRLKHSVEFEEWEDDPTSKSGPPDDIDIEL